ncbi:MAG: hypothetical protein Q8L74_14900 [Nitrospirota bacterium]|nr:hypothetical protein [Nitrospirota bacterium]MDP2384345.1 hypothetical protein [Nitrospirota bacterium]MDP3597157.1 hypothetical protein [Nitrospirota bacterium]
MGTALYLLRQQPAGISVSLFHPSDADMDILFVEQAITTAPSSVKGLAVSVEKDVVGSSCPTITYDDLVERIFTSEHVIVV